MCLTKLDVLDGIDTIKICVGYKDAAGKDINVPFDAEGWYEVEPVYEDIPGWHENTFGVQQWDDLPANAQAYIKRIEELVGAPVDIVSTGPDRIETIVLRHPFDASQN